MTFSNYEIYIHSYPKKNNIAKIPKFAKTISLGAIMKEIYILIGLFIAILTYTIFYTLANINFCQRYFQDVPTWECVLSAKYKYDND